MHVKCYNSGLRKKRSKNTGLIRVRRTWEWGFQWTQKEEESQNQDTEKESDRVIAALRSLHVKTDSQF